MLEAHEARLRLRLRRARKNESIRALLTETRIHPDELITPIFVKDGHDIIEPIESMPGINRYSADRLNQYIEKLRGLGIKSVLLFGIPSSKDNLGSEAYNRSGIIPTAIKLIKGSFPELNILTDVCLCGYTIHGHCGVLTKGDVDNDKTLELLAKAALVYAEAGADVVAPSAMMDGQVAFIRGALDRAGFNNTLIMSYSAKYASSFYGPFREAANSAPSFGDRRGYQINPPNIREAMREIELDISEGADIVMVKPALAYLDVIKEARERFNLPIAAYSVSGEYSMLKAAAMRGWIDERSAVLEVLTAIKRAGADMIITYFAEQVVQWLGE